MPQEWLKSDREWHRSVAQDQHGSDPGVAQEKIRSGTGVWPRSGPGATQEWLKSEQE